MEFSFRKYLEDAEDVLKIIRSSPNHRAGDDNGTRPPDFWDRYKQRWGVQGEFVEKTMSVSHLKKLIDDGHLMLSKTDDKVVSAKSTGGLNRVVISKTSGPKPLAVLDGSHSLVAAARNNVAEVDVIISQEALKYLGLK